MCGYVEVINKHRIFKSSKPVAPLFTTRLNTKKRKTSPTESIYVILLKSVKQRLLTSAETMFLIIDTAFFYCAVRLESLNIV